MPVGIGSGPSMSSGVDGLADPRVISLVGAFVAPATWTGHGKSWKEWVSFLGSGPLPSNREKLLGVTIRYLVSLRERGVSATLAQQRLSEVRFHLLLHGREDVTKDFILWQALKGWRKERVVTCQTSGFFFPAGSSIGGTASAVCLQF